ncbi:porin [Actinobacillus equuli]|uniref:porin n=1 Tax=Actinobacillus equuli TaxID=718 RepID=UPI0024412996|nr:porin [Actinobacillus equuli]WGE47318.1 porin [Actinobacillus equuli subsp. haemolyticus]WGE51539.1 porin [Actinobacillus equuli subsp. haemolyticus]
MKKTLVALAVTAFAASASAVTVYDAEGTKVQLDGSIRLIMEEAGKTVKDANGNKAGKTKSNLRNAGSRIGVRVNHDLGDGFFALGRAEFRFDGHNSGRDKFGDIYAKRAYAGLGKKELGEVTFGRQLTIADDYGQTDDYEYGIVPSYIETAGNAVVRYDYKGIEGLQLGANYNFAQNTNDKGASLNTTKTSYVVNPTTNEVQTVTEITKYGAIKNAYGLGAVYETQLGGNTFNVEGGYGRTNYETGVNNVKHYQDGYEIALGYTIGDLKLVGDFGYKYEKDGSERTKAFYVAPGFQYQAIPASRIYGNYLYERAETTVAKADAAKEKTHGFLLGVDYKFHKQVVAFVEGKYVQTKDYDAVGNGYSYNGKTTDKAIGVGMRVYW